MFTKLMTSAVAILAAALFAYLGRTTILAYGAARYQAGLAEACGDLIGHRPGRCPACRPPAFAPRTKALLAVLDLRSNGLPSIGTRTAALGALAVTRRRW